MAWLGSLTRKHGAPQALAERARIVLAAADGLNNKEIAGKVGVCAATAGRWRHRFAKRRIDGLYDEPRPGAPREIGDDEIAATGARTLLAQAVEAEVADFLARHADRTTADGRRRIVRHGHSARMRPACRLRPSPASRRRGARSIRLLVGRRHLSGGAS